MNFQPPGLKPRPIHPSSRPVPQPARPFDRPNRAEFTVESARHLAALIVVLMVASIGSCTVAPILGALEGVRMPMAPAQNKTAMVA
jgi:hypothetical protein